MTEVKLEYEWEPLKDDLAVFDEFGEPELIADPWEARYEAGDMKWSFGIERGQLPEASMLEAQWIAEMAKPVLDELYARIAKRRRELKGG